MNDPELVQSLVEAVQAAAKYAAIEPKLVIALVETELSKGRSRKETVKAVRNKLHQVGSAYQEIPIDYAQLNLELTGIPSDLHNPQVVDFCRRAMQCHASTHERLSFLDHFYKDALSALGPIQSLMDLACGLNPLSLPWLDLAPGAKLLACDIYSDMTAFINQFYAHFGLNGRAFTCDLIHGIPTDQVQLALLLKTIPCLEQIDKTIGKRLLSGIKAEHVLVSFPVHSLGGRGKGMRVNYDQHFQELITGQPWSVNRFDFSGELVFRLDRL